MLAEAKKRAMRIQYQNDEECITVKVIYWKPEDETATALDIDGVEHRITDASHFTVIEASENSSIEFYHSQGREVVIEKIDTFHNEVLPMNLCKTEVPGEYTLD